MAEGGKLERKDSSGSESSNNIVVGVASEDNDSVEISLKVRGLKPKSSASRFFARFSKPQTPEEMCANATFEAWNLTSHSFSVKLNVRTAKKARKPSDNKNNSTASEVFQLNIQRLPCEIDAEGAKFDVVQPPGRDFSFIMVKMHKNDSVTSWKQFQMENGTLDAS